MVEGNLLESKTQFIAHQTNCKTRGNGMGLAKHIFEKYPDANTYKNRKIPSRPGSIDVSGNVINMNAQFNPGKAKNSKMRRKRIVWFQQCLKKISEIEGIESIAFPFKIGCGLAGGDWKIYKNLIDYFAKRNPHISVEIHRFVSK